MESILWAEFGLTSRGYLLKSGLAFSHSFPLDYRLASAVLLRAFKLFPGCRALTEKTTLSLIFVSIHPLRSCLLHIERVSRARCQAPDPRSSEAAVWTEQAGLPCPGKRRHQT